jgi:hypothetical protein
MLIQCCSGATARASAVKCQVSTSTLAVVVKWQCNRNSEILSVIVALGDTGL